MTTPPPPPPPKTHALPPPFSESPEPMTLITQGAEALLYRTTFLTPTTPAALKVRPAKPWRHPTLDARLTRSRILAEARVLVKCRREGLAVPGVYALDWEAGWMMSEWIAGVTVKAAVRERGGRGGAEGEGGEEEEVKGLMRRIGIAVGRLHAIGVIHGDLTTSNMMLRREETREGEGEEEEEEGKGGLEGEIVLIDFGLATQAVQEEDRAVDLYVLERAFGSTHPREEGWFGEVLRAYGETSQSALTTLKRLEDVRMRGRKKSMLG